jgi:hypothetical protein
VRAALLLFGMAACVREPTPEICPPITEGELVVTEVRGPQMDDSPPEWIELYNAAATTTDLEGLRVRFLRPDGSDEISILVRRTISVPAGGYAVLALAPDADLPENIDYGFAGDFKASWLTSAFVIVQACGEEIDRASYSSLPRTGTYSLGSNPPTAEANDLPASWCTNSASAGTPGAQNIVCP